VIYEMAGTQFRIWATSVLRDQNLERKAVVNALVMNPGKQGGDMSCVDSHPITGERLFTGRGGMGSETFPE
jgi:hypothetical protein